VPTPPLVADPRDPGTAEPLRAILGYASVEPGVSECRNIYFIPDDQVARGGPRTRPCSTPSAPKAAEWRKEFRDGDAMYLCRDCVPRCLYDGLPPAAFNFAAGRAARGWRVWVVEGERAGVRAIELVSTAQNPPDDVPPVQAAWQRHVLVDGQWLLDAYEIRGWGVDDSGRFACRMLTNNKLFPPPDTRG
jgi:hypothetical protein